MAVVLSGITESVAGKKICATNKMTTVCDSFHRDPTINPRTGKSIKIGGPVYNALVKECGAPPGAPAGTPAVVATGTVVPGTVLVGGVPTVTLVAPPPRPTVVRPPTIPRPTVLPPGTVVAVPPPTVVAPRATVVVPPPTIPRPTVVVAPPTIPRPTVLPPGVVALPPPTVVAPRPTVVAPPRPTVVAVPPPTVVAVPPPTVLPPGAVALPPPTIPRPTVVALPPPTVVAPPTVPRSTVTQLFPPTEIIEVVEVTPQTPQSPGTVSPRRLKLLSPSPRTVPLPLSPSPSPRTQPLSPIPFNLSPSPFASPVVTGGVVEQFAPLPTNLNLTPALTPTVLPLPAESPLGLLPANLSLTPALTPTILPLPSSPALSPAQIPLPASPVLSPVSPIPTPSPVILTGTPVGSPALRPASPGLSPIYPVGSPVVTSPVVPDPSPIASPWPSPRSPSGSPVVVSPVGSPTIAVSPALSPAGSPAIVSPGVTIPISPRRIHLSPSNKITTDVTISELSKTTQAPWGAFNQPRRANEDTYQIKKIGNNLRYYAVFDGHGAPHQREGNLTHVAEYAQAHLHERIAAALAGVDPTNVNAVIAAIAAAFVDFDREMHDQKLMAGSTATVIIIDDARNIIYQVNLGDSRSIIYESGGTIIAQTADHKPTDPEESQRIRSAGGFVAGGRVVGNLAVARAFGDFDMKLKPNDPTYAYDPINGMVSAVPTITTLPKVPNSHIIITSDAPFERGVLDNQALVNMAESARAVAISQGHSATLGDQVTINMVNTIGPQTTDDTTVLYVDV